MNRRSWIMCCFLLLLPVAARGENDSAKAEIGRISVTVYYATNGDPKAAGEKTKAVSKTTSDRLRKDDNLRFKNYRFLGQDIQPLLRSDESWAQPLKPSDEVMVRFEAQGRPTDESAMLNLELWLAHRKTVKTVIRLEGAKPLYVLGPEWRGGRLIIAVALAPHAKPGP